ncbi:MAG: alkaline phosphatase family protein, partial [Candidatus Methylomirabilis sp.]|nr:alkaline phosphatase family protein [Deltaproteobacteria bacterium]
TIVFLMMENRSFDHYFGARRLLENNAAVDGLRGTESNPLPSGEPAPVFKLEEFCVYDPPHGWTAVHNQLESGLQDFVKEHYEEHVVSSVPPEELESVAKQVMGYHTRDQLPFYYGVADEFTLCDRWFCSVLGPTWPNRYYVHSASAGGEMGNDIGLIFRGGLKLDTIYHRLNDAGIPWRYYFADLPFVFTNEAFLKEAGGLLIGAPGLKFASNVASIERFLDDAAAGTLPNVCVVDPSFAFLDDHPPHNVQGGQMFVSTLLQALMNGPQWERSMFIVTYDEHGGFYDHVAPPAAEDDHPDFRRLSFRVPSFVAGPYQKRGAVSSVVYDHTSFAATLEWLYGLAPLTARDAAANPLTDTFDPALVFGKAPRGPVALPEAVVDEDQLTQFCINFQRDEVDIVRAANLGAIPKFLDRRGNIPALVARLAAEQRRLARK